MPSINIMMSCALGLEPTFLPLSYQMTPRHPAVLRENLRQMRACLSIETVHTSADAFLEAAFQVAQPNWATVLKEFALRKNAVQKDLDSLLAKSSLSRLLFHHRSIEYLREELKQLQLETFRVKIERDKSYAEYDANNRSKAVSTVFRSNQAREELHRLSTLSQHLDATEAKIRRVGILHGLDLGALLADATGGSDHLGDISSWNDAYTQLNLFLDAKLPAIIARHSAIKAAESILAQSQKTKYCTDLQAFLSRTANSLHEQMAASIRLDATATIDEHLHAARDPSYFPRTVAWLVFWTAVKATIDYARLAYGSNENEDQLSSKWCNAWERQFANWKPEVLQSLALPPNGVFIARGNLQSTGAETRTGADVLFALSTQESGKSQVKLALLQFKKDDSMAEKIDVWQNGIRQYATLERLAQQGGAYAMHVLLSRRQMGLVAAPAISLVDSKRAINAAKGLTVETTSSTWTAADCRIDWRHHGEAISTLLTSALCNSTTTAFDDAKAAFAWLTHAAATRPDEVPRKILLQAVGDDALGMMYALKHEAQLWAERLGYSYKATPEIVASRNRSGERGGPSL